MHKYEKKKRKMKLILVITNYPKMKILKFSSPNYYKCHKTSMISSLHEKYLRKYGFLFTRISVDISREEIALELLR